MKDKKGLLLWLIWVLEGICCGFGAILPGVSGGALMVAFGVYRPLIETLSHPKVGIKKYFMMLVMFVIGAGIGFVGFSGLVAYLLDKNATLVTCAFIGFIAGTFPELWHDAGARDGHGKASVVGMAVSFAAMCLVLLLLRSAFTITIPQNFGGWVICGVLWGLSFIVPGLSSSSLMIFFGIYQAMSEGVARLDFGVLIPMGIGMLACLLLLSKGVDKAFEKHFSVISHALLGIVAATAVMIWPLDQTFGQTMLSLAFVAVGFVASWLFTIMSAKIKAAHGEE